ncbi:MAG: hypothetical protein DI598_04335 [Pseudopedobacter saltans]|uniref:DUF4861 domain-containing protein n=1 Tax=Pseudopedobacter saltans TaxID=151895 RepID=A0A2W5H630_9SPHI|nr:MAG: hypothetical protein DI598_04335 [Pseudopedobacter saltans]
MKCFVVVCLLFGIVNCAAQVKLKIKNATNIERQNELVRIPVKKLKHIGLKKVENAKFLSVTINKENIINQTVDLDGDGKWDELVFITDFSPNETKSLDIEIANKETQNITAFAHARLKPQLADGSFGAAVPFLEMPFQNPPTDFSEKSLPPYLTEGPALENDKNAFRLYFDTRNTKDIYGKRQPRLVMDSVGSNTKHSYHHLSDWGMDILHVEKSLGAGSLAIKTKNPKGDDTLVRVAGKLITKESYKLLNDGPLFASFRMDYNISLFGKAYSLIETMSIWKGQYFYESRITISPKLDNSYLVLGIADFFQNKMDSIKQNKTTVVYSYGKQSENKDELGMAIVAHDNYGVFLKDAPKANSDITFSHLLGEKIARGVANEFRFYSCWILTNGAIANTEENFRSFLGNEAVKYAHPIEILE